MSVGVNGKIVLGLYLCVAYVVGAPVLYATMLRQRKKKLGGGKAKAGKAKGARGE